MKKEFDYEYEEEMFTEYQLKRMLIYGGICVFCIGFWVVVIYGVLKFVR